ncbi:MAG: toxin-antitoxin system, toxin component, HicA family protein [Acidobacteria bacterium]|nr:MAG: toxin-antitoxin system, toxin component, HicA family protein [Acidobacteriota bacterium]
MSASLPALKPPEVLRAPGKAGFYVHHVTGSHHILKHPSKPVLRITVPFHSRDLKCGTLASVY